MTLTMNEARYIIRMMASFRENVLFLDATEGDEKELAIMKERYHEAGGWQRGAETAIGEFILRVVENGVPGGEYIHTKHKIGTMENMLLWQKQRGTPLIERPEKEGNMVK